MLEFYKYITSGLLDFILFYLLFFVMAMTILSILSAFIKNVIYYLSVQILAIKRSNLEIELEHNKRKNSELNS